MQLSKTQKIYLALGAVAVAALVVDRVFLGDGEGVSGPTEAAAAEAGVRGADRPAPVAAAPTVEVPERPSLAARLDALARKGRLDAAAVRDAFVLPSEWMGEVQATAPEKASAPSAAEKFAAAHALSAVLLSNGGGCAVVNDQVVKIGQTMDGFTLLRLARESAVFGDGKAEVTLPLRPESGTRK